MDEAGALRAAGEVDDEVKKNFVLPVEFLFIAPEVDLPNETPCGLGLSEVALCFLPLV